MYKSCSRCGKIHDTKYKCYANSKARPDADAIRNTSRWQRKREEMKEASQYLCAVCRDQGRLTYEGLEVHHITKLRDDPSRALDDDNLICLCVEHHKQADDGTLGVDYLTKLAKSREE